MPNRPSNEEIMAGAPSPECRFVAVLNKKIETGRLLNALGHTTAGLVSLAPDAADMRFLDYRDADGSSHPAISHHPFIVLSADNSNQLRTLRAACMERGIVCNDFVNSMVVPIPEWAGMSETQLAATAVTREADLEYFCVVLFGRTEDIAPLTKKFSLFR